MTDEPRDSNPVSRPLAARIARDPLAHFIAAGAILFGIWYATNDETPQLVNEEKTIVISEGDMRQIGIALMAQGRELPTPEIMRDLARQEAIQRILVKEAISLGLDQNDEIIERRLAQKMDFLLADLAALEEPSSEKLKNWYNANSDRFQHPPRISFRHLYFSQDDRGLEGAQTAAADLLPVLDEVSPNNPGLQAQADQFMFRDYYGGRSPDEIARQFGTDFTEELFTLQSGGWQGPIRSGYGWHLVWIDTLEPGKAIPFETVKKDVRAAWLQERYAEIRERAYDEILTRYDIVIPDPAEIDYAPDAIASAPQALPKSE